MPIKRLAIIAFNFCLCISFGFGVLILYRVGKPFVRGFYCFDESISKPVLESTVPVPPLVAFAFTVCPIIIAVIEVLVLRRAHDLNWDGPTIKTTFFHILSIWCVYLYGAGMNTFFTDVGKYTIGRLRPHFLTLCDPDWSNMTCTSNLGEKLFYVGNRFCRNTDWRQLKEARLSFPSGHTSFAVYCALFMVFYFQMHKMPAWLRKTLSIPRIFIQACLCMLAAYCGLSRISDYKHHPTDVLGGAILGLVVAYFVCRTVLVHFMLQSTSRKVAQGSSDDLHLEAGVNDGQS